MSTPTVEGVSLPPPVAADRHLARISSVSNRVRVVAENRDDIVVDGKAKVRHHGAQTTIERVGSGIVVRVPKGTDLVIGTTSARVEVRGKVGNVSIVTVSGRISVERAESVDARTMSARIEVGQSANACRLRTGSGRISVHACGDADVATGSGRIELGAVRGPVHAHCVSGRIEVGLAAAYDVEAETVSGRITVSLPKGVKAYRPSGTDRSGGRPDDADCTIYARSVSGRVDVKSR